MGIGRNGEKTDAYQPGMELHGKYTLLRRRLPRPPRAAARGEVQAARGRRPQVYGIGLKELWEVKPEKHQPGLVMHTAGWPLDADTYGGSFLYHLENNQVAVGFVVGLGYDEPVPLALRGIPALQDPSGDPRDSSKAESASAYGARAIAAGGLQSLPKLVFPGGALVGDDAGFLNASRIKGSHCAIKSGMLAAEAAHRGARRRPRAATSSPRIPRRSAASWLHDELHRARNFKPWMSKGLLHRLADGRHRPGPVPRQGAVDAAPQACRPRNARSRRSSSSRSSIPSPMAC